MTRRNGRLIVVGLLGLMWIWNGGSIFASEPPKSDRFVASAQTPSRGSDSATAVSTGEADWQVIYIDDQRIGFSKRVESRKKQQGQTLIVTVDETELSIKRFGQNLTIQTFLQTEETETGELLSFVFEMKNPPAQSTRSVGRIDGNQLVVETTIAGRTDQSTIPWEKDVKSPTYQERLAKQRPLKPNEIRTFKTFLPELNKITTVKLAADDYRPVKLHDGDEQNLLKVRVTHSLLPTMTTRAYLNEKGVALRTDSDFLDKLMVTYVVPKETALEELAGEELDVAVSSLVRVDPIRNAHRTQKATYRIRIKGEDPSKYLAHGGTQQVKKIDDETVELTVTAAQPPQNPRFVQAPQEYRTATRFLQVNDPRVSEHARRAAATELDPWKASQRMERYVYEKMEQKNFSTAMASAAEVAKSLEGDCTEHAVLLAAMLRVQRIPSRIAVGLVYIERSSSFGGHMWTEAFIGGEWVPLDATLGRGGIGAAHIKMGDSSFADDAPAPVTSFLPLMKVLGKIEIDVLRVE